MAKAPRETRIEEPEGNEGVLPIPAPNAGYPFDGRPVLVAADGRVFTPAVWRNSRCFDQKTGAWSHTGFWALRNGGGTRVPFEPTHYRVWEEEPLLMNKKDSAA